MKLVKFKESVLVKSSSGLNYTVEAGKEVEVEEDFLRTLKADSYEEIRGKKKAEKDINISGKETKEITTKDKKTK